MKSLGFMAMALGIGAGCTGGGSAGPEFTLKVGTGDTALAVVQDGDGPWQKLVPGADGTAEIQITTGTYGLLYLCQHDTFPSATAYWAAEPPAGVYNVSCGTPLTTASIRGTTAPNAKIWTGYNEVSADAAGRFSTYAAVGSHDVFALLPGAPSRLLARRGVALSADLELDLPVATEGVAMIAQTPIVQGATGEVSIYTDLNTASGDYIEFGEDATVGQVPPSTMLIAGDHVAIGARGNGCVRQLPASETAPTLVLPAPLSTTVDRQRVTWVADPAVVWDYAMVEMSALGGFSFRAGATSEWLDAMGNGTQLALPDLPSLPGWPVGETAFRAGAEVKTYVGVSRGEYDGDLHSCTHASTLTW